MKKKSKKGAKKGKGLHKKTAAAKGINAGNKLKKENKLILLIIVAVLFLIAVGVIKKYGSQNANLENDAKKLLNAITSNNLKILDSDKIDEMAIEEIIREDYTKIKKELELENDFCIYFEHENGELIKIDGMKAGIGSSKVKVNGASCG